MIHLQKERFELSLDQLRKAELVARTSLQFKSTTYNNLACYYRRTGKIRTALTYLIQALELELKISIDSITIDCQLYVMMDVLRSYSFENDKLVYTTALNDEY